MNRINKNCDYDYDYIVIGSGFGGSVSAMRLSQKGYKVCVIEVGKRWKADDFADKNWNVRKYMWYPYIGCYGIQRMNFLKDVFILSGAGVGGGSLNYANTLYVPPDVFFERENVKKLGGKKELMPYYELAKKMLGVTPNPVHTVQDDLMKETAATFGREHTFTPTPVAVYFGEEGKVADDPYFEGEGPERVGCELCGKCMTGCKKDAKNTLDKNYLYFAEKFGTEIIPQHKVIDVIPLSENGSSGYEIRTKKITGLFGKSRGKTLRAKGVVFSAGTLGTLELLLKMKDKKRLPRLSDRIGEISRTNSEAIIFVKSKSRDVDFSKGVAITSSVHPDENTHIEPVRYGKGDDFMWLLTGVLTEGGGPLPRQIKALFTALFHPFNFLRIMNPIGWAYRTVILLVMQPLDNYINIRRKRRLLWPFNKTLTSEFGTDKKNPTWIPIGSEFGRRLAKKMDAVPGNVTTENLMDAPLTAHIMGGCTVGTGVIDEENRVMGYQNMLIVDGSQVPENLGVNPALSITALSERAMSFVPPNTGNKVNSLKCEKKWGVTGILDRGKKEKTGAMVETD